MVNQTAVARNLRVQAETLQEQVVAVFESVATFACDTQTTLETIKHNTAQLFFWTSICTLTCISLFLVWQLMVVKRQLAMLNSYQGVFERMWLEDREIEQRVRNEERHHREMEEQNQRRREAQELRKRQGVNGRPGPGLSRPGMGPGRVNGRQQQLSPPPSSTRGGNYAAADYEYDEENSDEERRRNIARAAEIVQNLRRRRQQELETEEE